MSASDDMELYDLRVTVDSISGRPVCGLAVGDYFEVTESSRLRLPPGGHFCIYALAAVLPLLPAKQRQLPPSDWLEQDKPGRLPGPGGTAGDADHQDLIAVNALVRPHLTTGMAEIGIAFQTDKPPGRYGELAAAAEAHGFDVVSVFADLLDQPPLPALLEMARATSRVRLGAACLNPYTQHPYEIAGGLAALNAASGGRAYLGLARGAWLDAIGIEQRRPLDHLRDTAAIVRALLSGDERGYAGAAYRLAPGVRLRYPVPGRLPPLLLGTWGARGAALAGEIADEVKVGGSANPAVVPLIRDRIAAGALAAGRSPGSVRVVLGAVTMVDRDGAAARRRARTEVARYLAVVADLDPTTALPDGLAGRVRDLVAAGQDSAAGALIPDDVLDRFAFSGTPSHVAGLARRVLEAGAGRVDFGAPHGLTDAEGVALLGTAVLPRLR